MSTDVSIILISHNKYPQNLFALYSLEEQTYAPTRMEVILVDDSSTDQTISLQDYTAPFLFKYCRSDTNLGRAGAKNFGVEKAEGKIVIFLDGEVMAAPDFVANHLRHYDAEEEITVSGDSSHFGTFSVLYPDFSKRQLKRLHFFLRKEPLLMERLAQRLSVPAQTLRVFNSFDRYTRSIGQPKPLLTKEDIAGRQFKQLSFPASYFHPFILKKYGYNLTGFHLAWTFFITRNVSVSKSLLEAVGPFSEEFRGWGSEDWELGYRLYKNGVKFIEDPGIVSYHQEHPFSLSNRRGDQMQNYALFTMLHPEIEVCALSLGFLKKNFIEINNIIEDYYSLGEQFPGEFAYSREAFIKLTQQIPLLLAEGKPVARLLQHAGLEKEADQEKLRGELKELQKTGAYRHYLGAFDLLLRL